MEFYVDDSLIGNMIAAPWEISYEGIGKQAYAIAYDAAGNSAMSNIFDQLTPDEYIPNMMKGQMIKQVFSLK